MSQARPSPLAVQATPAPLGSAQGEAAPRRRLGSGHRIWAAIWLGLIAYGGLVPFDFVPLGDAIAAAGGLGAWLSDTLTAPLYWHVHAGAASSLGVSASVSDWAANLLLFAPVGVFLVWDRPRHQWRSAWVRAVAVVAVASWGLECTQSLSPSRFASLNDVVANTASGAIGGLLGVLVRPVAGPAAFWLYCRGAAVRFAVGDAMRWLGRRPAWGWGVAIAAGVAVAGGFWLGVRPGLLGGWLPFGGAFEQSYDVAAWRLGLAAAGYAVLLLAVGGPLLAVHGERDDAIEAGRFTRSRRGLVVALAAVTSWAVVIEIGSAMRGGTAGMTGPLLAVLITAAALTAALLTAAAIRRRDRRRRAASLWTGVDRRRRPHRYESNR